MAFNSSVIRFEVLARARRLEEWETIIARNQWFQRKVLGALSSDIERQTSDSPILLSYSYTALEPFRYAKSHGWKTLLVQIDPGPEEERIVAEEVARVPELAGEWQPAPAQYWASWREECGLADAIIVNSEWSREGLIRGGVASAKLAVVPLAYEEEVGSGRLTEPRLQRKYPYRFTPQRPMRVLFLGQVNVRKGVARLLEAARILRDAPVEFWIVGPVQIANSGTLAKDARMKWFGPVTRNQAAENYKAADVFILPTLSDGFAITLLEAQAYGLPIIASRFCGGVVENGLNGVVLEEPSAACIATVIRDCIADPGRLRKLAAASGVSDKFTIQALAQQLQQLGATL
jgi:glycosyltransferase involved in cell wall biosynthesis